MKSSFFLSLLVLALLSSLAQAVLVNYTIEQARNYGVYSTLIQAQDIGQNPGQYFVCKVAFRESQWVKTLWNCNCGRRWYRWKKSWRCNYCDNYFWTQANMLKVTFCAYDNWDKQIVKTLQTGKTPSGNMREVACPKGQYASKIGTKFGWQYDTDTGFIGVQIKCENLNFTSNTLVQDTYGFKAEELSKNKQGLFASSLYVKYNPKDKLTGVKWNFESMPTVSKISIKYAKIDNLDPTSTVIETLKVANNETKITQKSVGFTKEYNITNKFTTAQSFTQGYMISQGVTVSPPSMVEATSSVTAFSAKPDNFSFNKDIITTFAASQNIIVLVPPGKQLEIISVIQVQKVNVTYEATLTFVDRFTGELIGTRVVTGVCEGIVASSVKTVITESDIPQEAPANLQKNTIEQDVTNITP